MPVPAIGAPEDESENGCCCSCFYARTSLFVRRYPVDYGLGILRMRSIFIGLVHLYQHYAPEDIRRRCLLQPTCSEYMILAIEKYGAVKGAAKGIRRLFFTCRGNIYRIDYPYESWK